MAGAAPNISLTAWRVAVTPIHALAIGSTTFRLYHRHQKNRLWWDDYWALISLLCNLVYCTTPWLRSEITQPSPVHKQIVLFWLTAILFPTTVWTARISIGMSIARLVPPQTRARRSLYAMTACFGLMLCALMCQKFIVCCRDTSWHHNRAVQCYLGSTVGILSLCTDITADTCLVVIPLHMLWRVKLPTSQRRLILAIFTSSILNSLAGIVYAVFVFGAQIKHTVTWGMLIGLSANLKAAITLMVCNSLVVVTYIYCLFWKEEEAEATEPSETRSKPTVPGDPTTILSLTQISDMRTLDTQAPTSFPNSLGRPQQTFPSVSS